MNLEMLICGSMFLGTGFGALLGNSEERYSRKVKIVSVVLMVIGLIVIHYTASHFGNP
jgi:NO-binding membrane sensor protein with MHYT domain